MSGNYDYPPASSRRPSRPTASASSDPTARFDERYSRGHQPIDAPNGRDTSTLAQTARDEQRLGSVLAEIRAENNQHQNEGLRESRRTAPRRPRERLAYLRNLIQSGSNRINAEDTERALDALNQEIEATNQLDNPFDRTTFEQARAAVERQIEQLRSEVSSATDMSRRSWAEYSRSEQPPSTLSADLAQGLRPPSSRTLRRRSFRPDLRGLSGIPEPLPTPSLMPQPSQVDRSGRGRLKRRKLESDDNREGTRGFNYGQYGQVVPGALKMEIASCDGGTYDPHGDNSSPENILRNDQSVYCTKSDRCNLILRHKGEAPFCLKKIVIKAPRLGFDSPIQEGMVFVSMTSDELLARTAQYQIQYSNSRRRRRNRRTGLQPSQEYLTAFRSPLQSLERTVLMGPHSSSALEDNETTDRNVTNPQPEFRVTTEYEDSEDSVFVGRQDDTVSTERNDDHVPGFDALDRYEDGDDFHWSDSEDSVSEDEEEDEDDYMSNFPSRRAELQRRSGPMRRQNSDPAQRRRQAPSLGDSRPAPAVSGSSGAAPSAEVLKPHARFFIEREKSMVSVKFDPPPSGRFILIKLWSPRSDGNIDIQSIIAHGYAGPRFFPSGGFR